MVIIEQKALSYAKKNNMNFIIQLTLCTNGCACAGGGADIDIEVKTVKEFSSDNRYNLYQCEGVNVFIQKNIKMNENVYVFQKLKLPLMPPIWGVKGVSYEKQNHKAGT